MKKKDTESGSNTDLLLLWQDAKIHFANKEYAKAIEPIDKILEAFPDNIDALLNKGAALYFLKKYHEALECFDTILFIQPLNTNALKNKAGTLYNLGQFEDANNIYDILLINNGEDMSVLNNKALTSIKLNNREEAADIYFKILSIDKGNRRVSMRLADIYKKLHRYLDELSLYNELLQDEPLSIDLLKKKGTALVNLEQYEKAIDTFNKILSIDLQNEDALLCKQDAMTKRDKKRKEHEEEQTSNEYKIARTYDLNNEGFDLLDKKEYESALTCFEKSLNIDTDNNDALIGKGIAKLALNETDEALECFDIVLEKDSENVKALINKGEALNTLDLHNEALACFDSALKIEPNNFRTICDKEKTLVLIINNKKVAETNKPSEEYSIVENSVETNTDNAISEEINPLDEDNSSEETSKTDSTLTKAVKAVEDGDYEQAITGFDQITDDTLLDEDTLYSKAIAYHHLKKYDETINCCNLILEKQPNHISAVALKEDSQAQKDKHNVEEEINNSEAIVAEPDKTNEIVSEDDDNINSPISESNDLDTLLLKGYTLFEDGEYDQAMNYFNQAEDIDPHNVRVLTFKGTTYHLQDKIKDAIVYYNQVLEQEPHNVKVLTNKGSALEEMAQYKEAMECYKKALETEPNNANTLYLIGMTYKAVYDYTTAIDYFTEVLKIEPDHAQAIEQKEATEELLDRMLKYAPKTKETTAQKEEEEEEVSTQTTSSTEQIVAEAKAKELSELNQIFKGLYDTNCIEEAIEALNQMIEIDPDNIDLVYYKGLCFAMIGKHQDAILCFDKVLVIDPENKDALHNRAIECLLTNKSTESAASFNKIGYTASDLLSLSTSEKENDELLFEVISELIDANENDYFNKIVDRDDEQRSVYKDIYTHSLKIVKKLHIDDAIEQRVAHYTSHSIANLLFSLTRQEYEPSPFRLNSVATFNDPKEGETLFDFLKISLNNNLHRNSDHQAFIGFFSFNTESLNQFRLYSKDNQQEATGVSIAVNGNFFNQQIDFNNSLIDSKNQLLKEPAKEESKRKKESLYRCIYVDPKTGRIISVGQKESYNIYRENYSDTEIESKLEAYNSKLKNLLLELKQQMDMLGKKLANDKLDGNIICELLIVLRYLVKHVAFKEEQECRIINIEELSSDKVRIDPANQRLYIDYIRMNKENVDVIYSAPLIDQFKIFRDILSKKSNIRTQICDHPFANDKNKNYFD